MAPTAVAVVAIPADSLLSRDIPISFDSVQSRLWLIDCSPSLLSDHVRPPPLPRAAGREFTDVRGGGPSAGNEATREFITEQDFVASSVSRPGAAQVSCSLPRRTDGGFIGS